MSKTIPANPNLILYLWVNFVQKSLYPRVDPFSPLTTARKLQIYFFGLRLFFDVEFPIWKI